jgi:Zn-dependent protease with chaperone function
VDPKGSPAAARSTQPDAAAVGSPHRPGSEPLGSATLFRFLHLILLLVTATAGLSLQTATDISQSDAQADIGCALAAGANPALGLFRGMIPTAGSSNSALNACWARYLPNVDWVPFAAILILAIAAAALYMALPWWKTRRARLLEASVVDPGGGLERDLDDLKREAGIKQHVHFRIAPAALTSGAVVFGTRLIPVVRLNAGLLVTRAKDPGRFRTVVLHELAHIKNRDITITYATVALWRVFVVLVLIPSAINSVYQLVIAEEPSSWQIFTSVNGYQLILTMLIAMMMYLVRADILRTRELYADVTADSWGTQVSAESAGTGAPTGVRKGARIAEALATPWRNHPSWTARQAVLESRVALFTVRALPTFATGFVVDLAYNMAAAAQVLQASAVQLTAQLATAALIVISVGLGLWRATAYALAEGKQALSGWATGWWLGAGIAASELVSAGMYQGEWFPRYPETAALLIVVVVVLTVWAAQYARARITAGGGGPILAQALIGLIPAWLTLALAMTLWDQYLPLDGWLLSLNDIYQGLGVPFAHPPALVRIYAVLAALPGGSLNLSSLWWAVPLLWLLPLLHMIRARFSGLSAGDRPRLRVPILAGLMGGLACCAAGLTATLGVGTIRGFRDASANLAAYEAWVIVATIVAMTVTVACLAARPAGGYLLLDALTACGLVALVSTAEAFLQTSVDGCLGPANALFTSHGCTFHPALAAQVVQECVGYTLGVAPLVSMAAAAAVHGVRRMTRRSVPDSSTRPDNASSSIAASSSVTRGAVPSRHRWALATLATAVFGLTCGTTLYASWPHNSPQAFSISSVFTTPPVPSPQTERLQLQAWDTYGGKSVVLRVGPMSVTFQKLLSRLGAIPSDADALRLAEQIVPPACAQLQNLATAVDNAFPVPVAQGQVFWARAGNALRDGTSACRRFSRAHDPASVIAADFDVLNAGTEADMLLHWIVAAEHSSGTAAITEPLGNPQLLTYNGVTLRFNAANFTLTAATAAGKAVPDGGRLATLDVESCIAAVPARVTLVGGPPENPGWALLFKDGRQVRAEETIPARAFDATPYASPGNVTGFSSASDCMGGLVTFDVPASERSSPTQVMLAPRKVPKALRWTADTSVSGNLNIIGTAQPARSPNSWITVTGYAVQSAATGRGGRIATITVQSCGTRIPQSRSKAWSQWNLLQADGALISPLNSPAAGLKATPYPLGREAIGSGTDCRTGSIQFDIPATDSADSLAIQYNGSTPLFWLLTPSAQ